MLKKLTSPVALSIMLLIVACAITAIAWVRGFDCVDERFATHFYYKMFKIGIGLLALGIATSAFLLAFKVRVWKDFTGINAINKWQLLALMNTATMTLFPAVYYHYSLLVPIWPASYGTADTIIIPIIGYTLFLIAILIFTNFFFLLLIVTGTLLPSKMCITCSRKSYELIIWRIVLLLLLIIDIISMLICIEEGAAMGVIVTVVYAYVLFSIHTGKIVWQENRNNEEA